MKTKKQYHWICPKCNLEFRTKNELTAHHKACHSRYDIDGNRIPWNKGLTAETSASVAKSKNTLKQRIKAGNFHPYWKGKIVPREIVEKQSMSRIKNGKSGGYRRHGGRGIRGWYKGIWCDSSWELAWVIYNIDHNIKFSRCTEKFNYIFDGKMHKYNPDFILENGEYVEIKGWSCQKWQAKVDQFPKHKKLCILMKDQLKTIIDYVISKYGKDFIRLYETPA